MAERLEQSFKQAPPPHSRTGAGCNPSCWAAPGASVGPGEFQEGPSGALRRRPATAKRWRGNASSKWASGGVVRLPRLMAKRS